MGHGNRLIIRLRELLEPDDYHYPDPIGSGIGLRMFAARNETIYLPRNLSTDFTPPNFKEATYLSDAWIPTDRDPYLLIPFLDPREAQPQGRDDDYKSQYDRLQNPDPLRTGYGTDGEREDSTPDAADGHGKSDAADMEVLG